MCNVIKKVSYLQTHKERLKHWLLMGFSLLVVAIILHFTNGTYPCIFIVRHGLPFTILRQRFTCISLLLQPSQSTSSSTASAMSALQAVQQELFFQLSIYWYGLCIHFRHDTSSISCYRKITNKKTLHLCFDGQIDVWGLRTPFLFLEWIGMNAMLVFVLGAQGILAAFVNGWYYKSEDNNLVSNGWRLLIWRNKNMVCSRFCSRPPLAGVSRLMNFICWFLSFFLFLQVNWIVKHVFVNVWHSKNLGTLLYVIFCEIVFWGVAAGVLHKLGIYWKLWLVFNDTLFVQWKKSNMCNKCACLSPCNITL